MYVDLATAKTSAVDLQRSQPWSMCHAGPSGFLNWKHQILTLVARAPRKLNIGRYQDFQYRGPEQCTCTVQHDVHNISIQKIYM